MSISRENIHITFASFWGISVMQNTTPQVCFRNVRQYCAYFCFNHCFVYLIRYLLGPCGPYSTLIWPPGDFFSTQNWLWPLRDRTKRSAKFWNTSDFQKRPHGRVSHFPACPSMIWTYGRHCESFRTFQCQVIEIWVLSQTPWYIRLPPVPLRLYPYRGGYTV